MSEGQRKLRELNSELVAILNYVARRFDRPDEVRVTLVIRTPWLNDGGVFISDDEADAVVAEIRRLATRSPAFSASVTPNPVHVSACKISDDDIAASFGVTPKKDGGAG